MSYLLKITVCLAFCHAYKQKLKLKRLGQLSRDRNKCFSMHTHKAKEGENCQQTALINHASINHILLPVSPSPPLTHQSGSKKMHLWPSSCFGLLLTIPPPSVLSLPPSIPFPLLLCQERRQYGVSWLQSPLCIIFYNFMASALLVSDNSASSVSQIIREITEHLKPYWMHIYSQRSHFTEYCKVCLLYAHSGNKTWFSHSVAADLWKTRTND